MGSHPLPINVELNLSWENQTLTINTKALLHVTGSRHNTSWLFSYMPQTSTSPSISHYSYWTLNPTPCPPRISTCPTMSCSHPYLVQQCHITLPKHQPHPTGSTHLMLHYLMHNLPILQPAAPLTCCHYVSSLYNKRNILMSLMSLNIWNMRRWALAQQQCMGHNSGVWHATKILSITPVPFSLASFPCHYALYASFSSQQPWWCHQQMLLQNWWKGQACVMLLPPHLHLVLATFHQAAVGVLVGVEGRHRG